jgi:galacturan 1,4-alpha-galacturonidase
VRCDAIITGVSIGSLGDDTNLSNITCRDSTFTNSTNAIRIKAHGESSGVLKDVTYANLQLLRCETTLEIESNYPSHDVGKGTLKMSDISFVNITSQGAKVAGYFECSINAPCENLLVRMPHRWVGDTVAHVVA